MATALQPFVEQPVLPLHKPHKLRIGIITAQWNAHITDLLEAGARQCLIDNGILPENIRSERVAGSFELPLAAQWLATETKADAVIALGCLIKGETPHFEYISEAVAHGIMELNLKLNLPVSFGVITVLTEAQALDRAGGKLGNKGAEAAYTALQMLQLKQQLS
jgi:6,7-dimethyl-8-ribityllumazine synthase